MLDQKGGVKENNFLKMSSSDGDERGCKGYNGDWMRVGREDESNR